LATAAVAEPIKLHPANPHYYLFNGQPTILITSAEHYGAVVNLDFDYVKYLDALKAYGMNYTRLWPGAVLELVDEYVKGNPLGPKPGKGPSCPGREATSPAMSMVETNSTSTSGIRIISRA
jgi:hypothetical protein